jgi:phage recombination protein Bet
MNQVAIRQQTTAVAHTSEADLVNVLRSSLYPGAKPDSVALVLKYCKASGLDPMLKPVHIVPMSVKEGNGYTTRDVIMPGIGLYRTQAARTGEYAGKSEPEFGPTIEKKLGPVTISFPEWCRVTVRRKIGAHIAEFTALEYWLENYATAGRDKPEPNTMWRKRPFGQIAKCAEAQALRQAFPEVGEQPTADEMAGKDVIDVSFEQGSEEPQPETKPARIERARGQLDSFAGKPATSEPVATKTAEPPDDDYIPPGDPIDAESKPVEIELPAMPETAASQWAKGMFMAAWKWFEAQAAEMDADTLKAFLAAHSPLIEKVRGYKPEYAAKIGTMEARAE